MALERRDPVPPGRYHVYVSVEDTPRWSAWQKENKGKVVVVATEAQTTTPNNYLFATTFFGDTIKEHAGDWVLFDVKSPVPWVNIGLPTIVSQADMNKYSARDFMQAPDPLPDSNPIEALSEGLGELIGYAKWGLALYAGFHVFKLVRGKMK